MHACKSHHAKEALLSQASSNIFEVEEIYPSIIVQQEKPSKPVNHQ